GKAQGRNLAKTPNRTWENRLSGIIGGPPETRTGWNVNRSCNRKNADDNPPPTAGAPELYPNQGERRSIQHVPDSEREGRVIGVGGRAESSKGKQGDEVHRPAPPSDCRSVAGKLLLIEEESRTRSGRSHLAGV